MNATGSRIALAAAAAFVMAMATAAYADPAGDDSSLPRCSATVQDKCVEGGGGGTVAKKSHRHAVHKAAAKPAPAAKTAAKTK